MMLRSSQDTCHHGEQFLRMRKLLLRMFVIVHMHSLSRSIRNYGILLFGTNHHQLYRTPSPPLTSKKCNGRYVRDPDRGIRSSDQGAICMTQRKAVHLQNFHGYPTRPILRQIYCWHRMYHWTMDQSDDNQAAELFEESVVISIVG
jgi:hypothetical protein